MTEGSLLSRLSGSSERLMELFKRWDSVRAQLARLAPVMRHGPEAGYEGLMNGVVRFSEWQTRLLQNGYMRNYILVMLVVLIALIGNSILLRHSPQLALSLDVRFHEVIVVGTMAMGAREWPLYGAI